MSDEIHNNLINNQVKLLLNTYVDNITRENQKLKISFNNQNSLNFDMIICSVGVTPQTSFINLNNPIPAGLGQI